MTRSRRTKFPSPPAYYPGRLDAVYTGVDPPNRSDDVTYDSESLRRYFRNYRNETLSRFSITPCEWVDQGISYIHKPSITPTNVIRNYDRLLAFPVNYISTVDPISIKEIDDFYKCVQLQRAQNKDDTGRLHPLKYFSPEEYNFQSSPSLSGISLKRLETYTTHKSPVVLPLTYEKKLEASY